MSSDRKAYSASRQFAHSDDARAWLELTISVALYFGAITVGILTIGKWWLTVPSVLIAAAMGLRVYMIQHDCLHRSFFSSRNLNDFVGTMLSPIAMTPYRATRYIHGLHHTYVSDLERRDTFEIFTMTLKEWDVAPRWKKLQYRFYRSPILLVVIGPFLLYGILRRMPLYGFKTGIGDLILHNLMLAGYLLTNWWVAGWGGIAVWAAAFYLACAFGALIPYVVHNFEEILWGRRPELTFGTAALQGSAVLDWGGFFDLVTMNIGYHDLHHLNAKIPGYKLRAAHAALEEQKLLNSHKIGFLQGLSCFRWKLYDEENERLVPFPSFLTAGHFASAK
ncbi:fatty acid desaturase [Ruegeria arenilitoris]|uniref:fatty acid desaturase n=1 Tax=Ruegeria arenilitoris TaxID=1173585 RepID=UPI00147D5F85|nr:fatty acid desaturase [Ruegeria arenilitoris]